MFNTMCCTPKCKNIGVIRRHHWPTLINWLIFAPKVTRTCGFVGPPASTIAMKTTTLIAISRSVTSGLFRHVSVNPIHPNQKFYPDVGRLNGPVRNRNLPGSIHQRHRYALVVLQVAVIVAPAKP